MTGIRIADYDPAYQARINLMMAAIQEEFREAITTHHSTRIEEVYRLAGQKYWVALSGEEVAGTIGVFIFEEGKAVIKRMMVHPRFRGGENGTALLLMRRAFDWARQQGAERVFLGTMEQFKAAQRFYLKNGFSAIAESELPASYPQNPMDTLFFARHL